MVMARKRRPPKRKRRAPKNPDALAQPIYVEDYYKPRGLGQVIQEPDVAAINNELVKKIWLLFEHYKIDPSDEHSWQELALSLALAHVRGLQVANRPKRGPKPKWETGLGDELVPGLGNELVRAVEDEKSQTGKSTKDAIAELLKEPKWGKKYSPQNLEARYWEMKRLVSVQKALRKDWKKGIFFRRLRLPRRRRSGGLTR
jgi:hypothetical protein